MVDDQTGTRYNGIGDTFDLSDGDLLIVRYDYLCVGRKVRMRCVRSDAQLRIFITVPHLEEGDLDHSKRRRRSRLHDGGVGMGRCS